MVISPLSIHPFLIIQNKQMLGPAAHPMHLKPTEKKKNNVQPNYLNLT
jgi:hypothetical protein